MGGAVKEKIINSATMPKRKHAGVARRKNQLTLEACVFSSMDDKKQFTQQPQSYVLSITGSKLEGKSIYRSIKGYRSIKLGYRSIKFCSESAFHAEAYGEVRVWNVDEMGLFISHGSKYVYCKKGFLAPEAIN